MQDIFPPNFGRIPEEGLKIISRCPVCHYQYNPIEAKVLEESDSAHLVYIKCRRCHSSILALVMTSAFGVSSVGLVTDLDGLEVARLKEAEAVSEDELLEAHELLKSGEFFRQV